MQERQTPPGLMVINPGQRAAIQSKLRQPSRAKGTAISGRRLFTLQDPLETLRFFYALNPGSFQRRFAKRGVVINSENDLIPLANLHATGMDVAGFYGSDGQLHAFNVMEIARGTRINKRALATSGIKFTDMVVHQGQVKILQH